MLQIWEKQVYSQFESIFFQATEAVKLPALIRTAAVSPFLLPADLRKASRAFAQQHGGEFVAGLSEQARQALRETIDRILAKGISPKNAAKLIEQIVGLDAQRAAAVANLRNAILENPGKKLDAGGFAIRVPNKVTDEFVNRRVEQYAARLRRQRALAIAKNETVLAANKGQRKVWSEAVNQGILSETERRWVVTDDDRLCPQCAPLDGIRAPIDGFYEDAGVEGPPLHNLCRCSEEIVPREF